MAASSERETEDGNCENIKATNGEQSQGVGTEQILGNQINNKYEYEVLSNIA